MEFWSNGVVGWEWLARTLAPSASAAATAEFFYLFFLARNSPYKAGKAGTKGGTAGGGRVSGLKFQVERCEFHAARLGVGKQKKYFPAVERPVSHRRLDAPYVYLPGSREDARMAEESCQELTVMW